jgi:uncharacterized protein (TIGR03437 family)
MSPTFHLGCIAEFAGIGHPATTKETHIYEKPILPGRRGNHAHGSVRRSGSHRCAASTAEDPANRRKNGGGRVRFVLQVIPMSAPQIVAAGSGPAITHSSDSTVVTAAKPAAAGEILSVAATGLGPTRPGVDPGQPFPSSPPAAVNSPVQVLVNGKPAEVLAAVGCPGTVDGYRVNFRVPPDVALGTATIQVRAAWIAGSAVTIAISNLRHRKGEVK